MPTLDRWRACEECREHHGVRMEVKMALLSLVLLNKRKPDY